MYSANGSLDWRDAHAKAKIRDRIDRLSQGNFGDCNHWAEHCANSALIGGLAIGIYSPWLVERLRGFCCVWRRQAQASLRHSACTRILKTQGEDAHTVKSKTKGKAKILLACRTTNADFANLRGRIPNLPSKTSKRAGGH